MSDDKNYIPLSKPTQRWMLRDLALKGARGLGLLFLCWLAVTLLALI